MENLAAAELDALRQGLPEFADASETSPELQAFCANYCIDFDQRLSHVSHRAGYVASGNYRLATHRWTLRGARGNLLLVHGYFDHTGLFDKLIRWGLESGYNVLMFDLPGHGLSTGEPASIGDFGEYAQAIHNVLAVADLPELPLYVMAQSTGCAALMELAQHHPWPFDAAVFLAPLIRPANWRFISVAYPLLSPWKSSVPRGFARNSGDQDFLNFIRNDPLQSHRTPLRWVGALKQWLKRLPLADLGVGPILVVQGEADGTVWWRYNMEQMPKLFPGCDIFYLSDAGHQLANETTALRQQYLARVSAWFARPGKS
ncbi:MAG: alpha/beta hydrolase [Pseudomonadota bacterium]